MHRSRFQIIKFRAIIAIILFWFAGVFSYDCYCQNRIQEAVAELAKDIDFKFGSLSICITDLENDSVIASYQPYTSLIPASTLKIFTTFAALSILGPDYRFRTELQMAGEIVDSTLKGDIFIKGGGDPSLGSARFPGVLPIGKLSELFSEEIKKQGIKNIEGAIVGDGSYFDYMTLPGNWQWDDIGNYYGAGASGLNFHDNEFTITFKKPLQIGDRTLVEKLNPLMPGVVLINDVVGSTPESGDNVIIYGEPYGSMRYANGTIPSGNGRFNVRGSLPNPPLTCAQYLLTTFKDSLHHVINGATDLSGYQKALAAGVQRRTFYSYSSPKLSDIILQTNHRSVNLYAETLLKELGKKQSNSGTTSAGIKIITDFWKSQGLDTEGLFMEDGSGLSPRNGVSAFQFVKALSIAFHDTLNYPVFYRSIPKAGEVGTVRNFLTGQANKRIRLKSGSMKRVKSYCGYAISNASKNYAFSIIANNYNCSGTEVKRKIENIILLLVNQN